jgi:HD domain
MPDQAQLFSEHAETAKNGFYTQHLADVSNKGNSAFTTDDVFNEHGALLVRKGVAIDNGVRDKLIKHKLLKPLDHQVGLDKQANTDSLIKSFHQLMKKYPDIQEINDALHYGPEFEKLLNIDHLHPIVTQKLTILDTQLNTEFEKCMFNAWLSTITARELDLNKQDINSTFVASLLHDIGMMHLDPSIVQSDKQLTPTEWKTVQAHVVVGKIIADGIPDLSPDVSRAVLEHHETCFGSGYPFAISGYERCMIGRIIGMSDSIHAIRVNKLEKDKRTLGDIQPYLQLNSATQSNDVYRAMMSIVKKSKLKPTRLCPVDKPTDYAKKIEQQVEIMSNNKKALDEVYNDLSKQYEMTGKNKHISTILAILRRMLSTTAESGLLSHDLLGWLHEMADTNNIDDHLLDELNEIDLLITELTWQLRNTSRMLCSYYGKLSENNKKVADSVMSSISTIKTNLEQLKEFQTTN